MPKRFRFRARTALALALAAGILGLAPDDAPAYGFSFVPPPPESGKPEILKIELNSGLLHAGGPIAIRVTTARDVARVVTGSGSHQGTLARIAPGVFTGESTLPHFGGILRVHIKLRFEATTADGRIVEVDVPVDYK